MTYKKVCPYSCGKEWIGSSNRRAKKPLDPDATAAANQTAWENCPRLIDADGTKRKITMSNDDYFCRRVWMDAYLETLEKKAKKKLPPKPKVDPKCPVFPCERAQLAVEVITYKGKAIKDATVTVTGIGVKYTDEYGIAHFGEVAAKTYEIKAEKDGYSPAPDKPIGRAKMTKNVPPNMSTLAKLKLYPWPIILKENIIFIGSEEYYDNFWNKMIFIATGFTMGDRGLKLRKADKKTIALVDVDYTKLEKGPLEILKKRHGFNIVTVCDYSAVTSYINNRPENQKDGRPVKTLIQDVAFFCHGLPKELRLNYRGSGPDIKITNDNLSSIKQNVFVKDGRIYSYACRTGVSSWKEKFDSDAEAGLENSLAQKMADHFRVEVHAFLRRTFYGEVLREKNDSKRISDTLKKARKTREGQVIDIPPVHEGLPHPWLGGLFGIGSQKEGTFGYALWRKAGAIRMPFAAKTPEGLSRSMRRFRPKK